jgi:hypothetical protein
MALSACGPEKPIASAPPPPPARPAPIPQRPYPPDNASANLVLPRTGSDGLYVSPNRNISPAQIVWNLRSAYNVAALNCHLPQHAAILDGYRAFLRTNARTLTALNRQVDSEFRAKYGSRYIPLRETYMTEVYNHFAFPPTLTNFCDAVLAISRDAATVKSADLQTFAAHSLPNVEIVFDDFYRRYARYQTDLAAWEGTYGARVNSQPGGGTRAQ